MFYRQNRNASLLFHLFIKDVSKFSSLKKYHKSGPITDATVVVESRTGNTGFLNVISCLFNGRDVLPLSNISSYSNIYFLIVTDFITVQ